MRAILIFAQHVRIERLLFSIELLLFIAACAFYAYSIVSSVVNVVLRQELTVAVQDAHARVGELESSYLLATGALTERRAIEQGFVVSKPVGFVTVDRQAHLSRLP